MYCVELKTITLNILSAEMHTANYSLVNIYSGANQNKYLNPITYRTYASTQNTYSSRKSAVSVLSARLKPVVYSYLS